MAAIPIIFAGGVGVYATCFSKRCEKCSKRHADWACHPADLAAAIKHDAANRPEK